MTIGIILAVLLQAAPAAPPAASPPTPAGAPATQAIPGKPADPAAEAAARELLKVSNFSATMRKGMERPLAAMRSGAVLSAQIDANPAMKLQRSKNPQGWNAALARIGARQAAAMEKVIADLTPEVEAKTVSIYATNFTVDELRQITAFYGTPLGRMMLERLPAVSAETVMWTQTEMPRRLQPLMAAMQPEIERELRPLMPAQAGGTAK